MPSKRLHLRLPMLINLSAEVATSLRELRMSLASKSVFLFQEFSEVFTESVSNFLVVHSLIIPRRHGFGAKPLALVLGLEASLLLLLNMLRDFK